MRTDRTNYFVLAVSALILASGCSAQKELSDGPPRLAKATEMPVLTKELRNIEYLELRAVFHVKPDGEVLDVVLRSSSGDSLWDASAVDSLKTWQFEQTRADSSLWFIQMINAEFIEKKIYDLGKVTVRNRAQADSLSQLIKGGYSFTSLFESLQKQPHPDIHSEILLNYTLANLPRYIRTEVAYLSEGELTRPVFMNGEFVLYKRLWEDEKERGVGLEI